MTNSNTGAQWTDFRLKRRQCPRTVLGTEATALIRAWFEINHLKQLFRKGWLERGLSPLACETVAEHSFGNAMLCLLLLDDHPDLDSEKVLRLALLHDIGEAYVGDITPRDKVDSRDKSRQEARAVEEILGKLPNGERLIEAWHEYELQDSAEAKFVKQVDRLELALQASVYSHQGQVDPGDFFKAAEKHLHSPVLRKELDALIAMTQASRQALKEA